MLLDELRTLLTRHARPDGTTAIEHVRIGRAESQAPHASMTGTVMALIAQGAKRLALGEYVYEYRAGQYLVASVDLPVTGHFVEATPERPALGLGLLLQASEVAEVMLQAAPRNFPQNGTAPPLSPSVTPPTSSSTPPCDCCACSTSRGTGTCSPPHQAGDPVAPDHR